MFLFQEIEIKLCQSYTKTYIYEIWYKNLSFEQIIFSKYATNLKTTITQRSLNNSHGVQQRSAQENLHR